MNKHNNIQVSDTQVHTMNIVPGRVEHRESHDKLKAEESFPISENGYTLGRLLDGIKCQLLLDMDTSKSFMSKSFCMHCKSLHILPKFVPTTQKYK